MECYLFCFNWYDYWSFHTNLQNINVDENLCYVILEFACEGDSYEITRSIAPKSDLKIVKNNIDVSGKGIKESSKKLEEYLPDITYELIASTIILGQGLPQKFSAFSPSGRKELLEKLTKSDFMIEDVKNRVSDRASVLATELRNCEDRSLINNTKLENLLKTKENLKQELDKLETIDYNSKIKTLTNDFNNVNTLLCNKEAELSKAEPIINQLNIELNKKITEKNSFVEEEFGKYKEALTEQLQAKASKDSLIKVKEAELKRLKSITDICPTCGQKMPQVKKPDTATQEQELKELNESLTLVKTSIANIENKHQEYTKAINDAFNDDLQKVNEALAEATSQINALKGQVNTLGAQKNQLASDLAVAEKERNTLDNNIKSIKTNIAEADKAILETETAINSLATGLTEINEHIATVKKIDTLIKRDFRGYLLSNIIDYLAAKSKEYCKIVFDTTDLAIYLDGNNLDVTYCDKLLDNLSGGERTRVDLILQLSIRDLLCKYFGYTSNILVLDEVTDFLDAKSCDAVMRLISTQLQDVESVFIISHHAESLALPVDSELKIIKNTNGISEVI